MDKAMLEETPAIRNEKGTAILVALSFLAVLMIMTSVFMSNLIASSNFESSLEARTKSFYIAEAGLNHAIWKLSELGEEYEGESGVAFEEGSFDITVEPHAEAPGKRIIISRARLEGYLEGTTESEIRVVVTLGRSEAEGFDIAIKSWEARR